MKAVLDHVGTAVQDLAAALAFYRDALGLEIEGEEEVASELVRAHFVPVGESRLELLEATAPESPIARYIDKRGPGLHHVTFEVEDIDRAAAAIREFGIEPMGGVQRSHGWAETYIRPKDSGGVLFQFYVEEEPHEHPHADDQIAHSHEYDSTE